MCVCGCVCVCVVVGVEEGQEGEALLNSEPGALGTVTAFPSGEKVKAVSCSGKKTGVGCHSLLQGVFLTQGWNSDLLHGRQILYRLGLGKSFQ